MASPGPRLPQVTIGRCMLCVAASAFAFSGPVQFILVAYLASLALLLVLLLKLGLPWLRAFFIAQAVVGIALALSLPLFVTARPTRCGVPPAGPPNLAPQRTPHRRGVPSAIIGFLDGWVR